MLTVLFAILFQSLHSYEHLLEDHAETEMHQTADHSQQLLHQKNHDHDKCFACDFIFSSFVSSSLTTYSFEVAFEAISYSFTYNATPSFFSGSSFSLRGPPSIC